MAELCDGLDPQRRDMVVRLVGRLHEAGFLLRREPEPDGLLSEEVEHRFGEQISFLDHDGAHPRARFRRWRESRVLVVGSGPAAVSAVRSLLRNGACDLAVGWRGDAVEAATAWERDLAELADAGTPARLEVFRADSVDALSRAAGERAPDAVILTPEEQDRLFREQLLDRAYGSGSVFVTARLVGEYLVKGPLLPAGGTSCWACAETWLAENAAGDNSETCQERTELYPAVLAATGSELALEVFRHIAAAGPSGLERAVVIQEPLSLAARREALPAHPRCRVCASQVTVPDIQADLLALAGGRLDLPADPEERYGRYRAALAETTGLLSSFDDGSVPQTAVKVGAVRAQGPTPALFAGFHGDSLTEARCAAVERAARRAAAVAPVPLATVSATRKELADQGEHAVPADQLAVVQHLHQGTGGEDEPTSWTPAVSLLDRRTVWVPAELVSGEAPAADAAHALAGYGAGATLAELATDGVLSALLHERVQKWRAGAPDLLPEGIPLEEAAAESGLTVVPGLARSGSLVVAELPGTGPVRVVAVRHVSPDGDLQVVAVGAERGEALRTALVEVAGRLQHGGAVPDQAHSSADGGRSLLCAADWPALQPVTAAQRAADTAAPDSGADRLAWLLAGLRTQGRDALLVGTAPAPLGGLEAPLRVGRVLLTP